MERLSVHERIEGTQEKDPDKMYGEDFSVHLKSGGNPPASRIPRAPPKVRVMTSPDE